MGEWTLITFYYLLRVGEYTKKCLRNNEKQTAQFKLRDVTLSNEDKMGRGRKIPHTATDDEVLAATGATLKLDNMKNGWKGGCVYHEANGDSYFCPVKALARRFVHVRRNLGGRLGWNTFLLAYFVDGFCYDLMDKDIRENLK